MIGAAVILTVLMSGCASSPDAEGTENRFGIPEMSEAEAFRLSDLEMEEVRANLRNTDRTVDVDAIKRIRFVSPEELPKAMAECMTRLGFETTVSEDGGYGGSYTEEQMVPYTVANLTCRIQYPPHPKYTQPLNDAQLEFLYDYFVDTLTPCLEGEGISVDPAPSRATFVEEYYTHPWSPYDSLGRTPSQGKLDWIDLNKKCPQIPDGIYG
ncbi:hypothetical protein [Homoserinimonas sp. A520]